MLLENVIISNVISARRAIFSTLYIGKSSGKQDHFTRVLILYGLSCKNCLDFLKICILDISWKLIRLDLYTPYFLILFMMLLVTVCMLQ